MGCFPSTARDRTSTPNPHAPTPSTTTTPRIAIVPTTSATTGAASTTRPNSPLRPARPWRRTSQPSPTGAPWTPALLRRERAAFFDTRVTGSPEVWAAVRLAAEMAATGDLAGAQGLLDAAGCTVPRGRLEDGVWDERGTLYSLPRWVVGDPLDMDGEEEDGEEEEEEEEAEDEEKGLEVRRDEKGKARSGDRVRVRARLSDRGTDVVVVADKAQSVRAVVKLVQEKANIPTSTKVKLAYLGKILKESESLHAQGWKENHVVNALVFQ